MLAQGPEQTCYGPVLQSRCLELVFVLLLAGPLEGLLDDVVDLVFGWVDEDAGNKGAGADEEKQRGSRRATRVRQRRNNMALL